nr:hypothetical protein [Tanacetum cinerariifolium]
MRTRSQSRNNFPQQEASQVIVEPLRIELPFLEDQSQEDPPPEVRMADNRTMAELLQEPIEGYEDAIVIPKITANNFELKHGLINLFQNKQFFRHDKEDLHAHIRYFNKITSTMRVPNLHQLDTFYNALNINDQDSLNSAAGGNFLEKMPRKCLKIIESKSKVRQSRAKAVIDKVSTSSSTPAISSDFVELKDMVKALLLDKKNQSPAPTPSTTPAPVKAVEPNCVNQALVYQAPIPQTQRVSQIDFESYVKANDAILRNMQSQGQMQTPSSQNTAPVQPSVIQSESQALVSEPVVAPVGAPMPNLKPSIPYPSRHDNEKRCDQANEQIEKFYKIFKDMSFEISFTDALTLMPKFTSTLKALIGNKETLNEMARTPMNEHCSAVILNKLPRKLGDPGKFLIPCEFSGMENFEPDPRVPLILRRCFLKTSRALIDVHKGELTLRIGKEAITYNLDQTMRYSANYDQMTANKIDVVYEIYSQEVLGFSDVTASGNPTPYNDPIVSTTSPNLTLFRDSDFLLFEEADAFLGLEDDPDSSKINPFYYDLEGDILLLETILYRTLPGNTITNPKEKLKGIATRSGVAYQGPKTPSPSKQGTKVTKDQVQTPSLQNTAPVQPSVIQSESQASVSDPVAAPVALIGNKEKLNEMARTPMNEHCSAVILNKLPRKLGDPGKFLIPCEFPGMDECLALVDLDVSFKVGVFQFPADFVVVDFEPDPRVPLILGRCFLKIGRPLIDVHKGELTLLIEKEAITYNLDQTVRYSTNYDQMTANKIDFICETYSQEVLGFSDVIASGNPTPDDDLIVSTTSLTLTLFGDSDFLLFEEVDAFLGLEDDPDSPKINPFYYDPEGDILLLEAILNSEPLPSLPNHERYFPSYKKELKVCEAKTIKSSVDEPPEVELKDLPYHLEYAFLEGDNKLPVIIAKELGDEEKSALIKVLKSHKRAIAWKLSDIQGINPKFYTHKILMEEDYKPAVQHQRRVNPKIHDVIKKEVEKLLDAGLIYSISESPWVSLTMEVFMDDFLVFGNSFENCLSRLEKMLQWCEDTNLSLNWEKSHFMVKEGIVLGHKISKNGIEVDKAKIDVIAKLPHPTTVKGIQSFLGHASFYRRFIQDFSKISRPMTHLLEKNTPFVFSEDCIQAFQTLKKKLTEALILIAPIWDLPFELMCDASDFAI